MASPIAGRLVGRTEDSLPLRSPHGTGAVPSGGQGSTASLLPLWGRVSSCHFARDVLLINEMQ